MSFLSVSELYKTFGDRPVLTGVSFHMAPGEKAGLIGPNGSGKTTLLRTIAGEHAADRGEVHLAKQAVIGYLPQKPPSLAGQSLRLHLEGAQRSLRELAQEINRLEKEISNCPAGETARLEKLLHHYGEKSGQFQLQGGYELESRLQSVVGGLGFADGDLDRELSRFSGGEKTRAQLAALLLQDPDLLLLDEPTNYLDQQGLEWLERYLIDWPRALIVVTHDRFFLDRVVGRILLLEGGLVKSYPGHYSTFSALRKQEELAQSRAYSRQQTLLQKEEKFIRESKIDERSKRQAAGRQKQLQKMELVEKPLQKEGFHLDFRFKGRSGQKVIEFKRVTGGYRDRPLFKNVSFEIRWGDRVALVGPNGAGKTTLLKLMTGDRKPDAGEIEIGPAVRVAYYSQEQENFDPERTLLEEMISTTELTLPEGRNHLGRYLFRGEQVFKQVKHLSGGEKCRLALARLELIENNCLLLDEPTSHLDLTSLGELEQTLQGYPGTLLLVSHDRYFLGTLVNRVFELDGGRLTVYEGSYQDYVERRQQREAAEERAPRSPRPRAEKEIPSPEHREQRRRIRRIEGRQLELEEAIHAAEEEIAGLELKLADPALYSDYPQVKKLHEKLRERQAKAQELLKEWEQISLELETLLPDEGSGLTPPQEVQEGQGQDPGEQGVK